MIPLTIAVALVGVVVALLCVPPTSLGLLICSMLLYPEYLRVPVGPVKMSVSRFMAMALLIRYLTTGRSGKIKWKLIDTLICCEWAWAVTANILAGADVTRMSEVVGRVFDSVLMYFVARLSMLSKEDYPKLFRPLLVCAVVAGVLGVVEAVMFYSPFHALWGYSAVGAFDFGGEAEFRYGFLRASGATSMSIYFGMAMFILMGMIYSMRGYIGSKLLWTLALITAFLGTMSSMSSGPQSALVIFIITSTFYAFPRLIKPAIVGMISFIIFCELASNRNFWYLIEYVNPAGGDYWYRSRLIDVAIAQWGDYWLIGMGSLIPNHWGMMIDGRVFVDIVNEYVIVGITSGFLGLALRLGIQGLAIRESVLTYRRGDKRDKWLAFGQVAMILGLMIASVSVGSFGAQLLMTYMMYGMAASRAPLRVRGPARAPARAARGSNAGNAGNTGGAGWPQKVGT